MADKGEHLAMSLVLISVGSTTTDFTVLACLVAPSKIFIVQFLNATVMSTA